MADIDQRRVIGTGSFNERPTSLGPGRVHTNRDDLQTAGVQLGTQRLPYGQITGTPSIGRPRHHQHLLPDQRRQPKWSPLQVRELQLRRLGRRQHMTTKRRRTQRPQAISRTLHERHAKTFSHDRHIHMTVVDHLRKRHAHLAAARAVRFQRPPLVSSKRSSDGVNDAGIMHRRISIRST